MFESRGEGGLSAFRLRGATNGRPGLGQTVDFGFAALMRAQW